MDKQQTELNKNLSRGASPWIIQEIEDAEGMSAFFTCTSGKLLWGQLNTVIEGSTSALLDTEYGPNETTDPSSYGGTIIQNSFRFKVAARKGQWKAEAVFLEKSWHIGYVVHHLDMDGLEMLNNASEMGIWQDHVKNAECDMVYVNRYDWSSSHSPNCELILQTITGQEKTAEEVSKEEEDYYQSLVQSRFMLLDAQGLPTLIKALKDGEKLEQKNYLLRYKDDTGSLSSSSITPSPDPFGIHLVVADTEYELGWMVFQKKELVGFVYDGAYSALEGKNLRLDDTKVSTQEC